MTEGDGGTRKNVRDEMEEAAGGRKKGSKEKVVREAAEKETTKDSSGGVKDNVQDDMGRSQNR